MRILGRFFSSLFLVSLIAVTGGCASYYLVKDPESGNSYYTRKIDQLLSGAIKFKDDRTGEIVTIQNSDVKEIEEREYDVGKYASK